MPESKEMTHVYFMPGLGAGPAIFENIKLPEDEFEMHFLEWLIPYKNESLTSYCQRLNNFIEHDDSVLIGVSFGGVIVQEMSKLLKLKRLIIISSVKCSAELPPRMKFARKTGFFRILPTGFVDYLEYLRNFPLGSFIKRRIKLFRKYIVVRDREYLDWAVKNMLTWDCEEAVSDLVHIHGNEDEVFPYKNIRERGCITVKGGTHIMILNKYRWFNRNLPEIIRTGNLKG